jgi:outer membrane protein
LCTLSLALPRPARCRQAQDLAATIADALAHAPALAEAKAEAQVARARLDAAGRRQPLLAVEGQIGTGRIDNGGFFGFTARM